MENEDVIEALSALAQTTRLEVYRLLVRYEPEGLPAGEIARRLGVPHNTMSSHLAVLSRAALVRSERYSRQIVYRADRARVAALTAFLDEDCCGGAARCAPAEPKPGSRTSSEGTGMADRYNVLFLCTGNSARSILAESLLTKLGEGRFQAFSAGSQPKGTVNPIALRVLESYDFPVAGMRSKSWEEFAGPGAPVMDFVFTVCDSAAGETCPVWPGQPMTAHWGIEDPAAVEGTDIQKEAAFVRAFRYLRNRISAFVALPVGSLDRMTLRNRLDGIGRLEGASGLATEVSR